jgi:hypothetical protein
MSFLNLPQIQPARAGKDQTFKLINQLTRQLATFIPDVPQAVAVSGLINLAPTTVPAIVEVVPPRPGFYFIASGAWFVHKTTTGTATGAPALCCGNDASAVNVVPVAAIPGTAEHAAGAPRATPLTLATSLALVDMATPILAAVTVAATGTGSFAWSGYVHIAGHYVVA